MINNDIYWIIKKLNIVIQYCNLKASSQATLKVIQPFSLNDLLLSADCKEFIDLTLQQIPATLPSMTKSGECQYMTTSML